MAPPDILLLACYEMGHQPLSLAWPTAVLRQAGFQVALCDLAVESWPATEVAVADLVGIAVPMHTAMRLGVQAAERVRAANPQAHIVFYGLYARLNADYLLQANGAHQRPLADSVISGEYEQPLLQLAQTLQEGREPANLPALSTARQTAEPHLARLSFPLPDRRDLPGLEHYAHYMDHRHSYKAGYVEASRGCLHTCRHCPVVPIYDGRFFIVPAETVLADIRQQVAAGARHITFGDPDFLNGPGHVLKIVRTMHQEFPQVTFDFTTKVEHILEKAALFPELRQAGASFVISAFEATSDEVLAKLDKGHTLADMEEALAILRQAELPVQPTWMPFTPWTSADDYLYMLRWIREQKLINHIPAVQYTIRLLIPPESALLIEAKGASWLGPLAPADFGYCWQHPDPRMDQLQQRLAHFVEHHQPDDGYATFEELERLVYQLLERPLPPGREPPTTPDLPPPRLTEDWFC